MRRSGSKSLLQRVVEKALPNAMVRRQSPEHPNINLSKSIDYNRQDNIPGIRTTYHASYTVIPDSEPDFERRSYHSSIRKRTSQHRIRANKLSLQTKDHTTDEIPPTTSGRVKRLNLDNFIRKIESWSPPSPKEVLARRLFREVQQAATAHPQATPNRPSTGGYLVHRRIKSEPAC